MLDPHNLTQCLAYCIEWIEKTILQVLEEPNHKHRYRKTQGPEVQRTLQFSCNRGPHERIKRCTAAGLRGICRASTPAPARNVTTHKPLQVDGIFPTVKDVLWFKVNIMPDIKVGFWALLSLLSLSSLGAELDLQLFMLATQQHSSVSYAGYSSWKLW